MIIDYTNNSKNLYDNTTYYPLISENKGWTCPQCGRVNAPWKVTCACYIDNMPRWPTWPRYGETIWTGYPNVWC